MLVCLSQSLEARRLEAGGWRLEFGDTLEVGCRIDRLQSVSIPIDKSSGHHRARTVFGYFHAISVRHTAIEVYGTVPALLSSSDYLEKIPSTHLWDPAISTTLS